MQKCAFTLSWRFRNQLGLAGVCRKALEKWRNNDNRQKKISPWHTKGVLLFIKKRKRKERKSKQLGQASWPRLRCGHSWSCSRTRTRSQPRSKIPLLTFRWQITTQLCPKTLLFSQFAAFCRMLLTLKFIEDEMNLMDQMNQISQWTKGQKWVNWTRWTKWMEWPNQWMTGAAWICCKISESVSSGFKKNLIE